MNAWTIYWIMQLDTINRVLGAAVLVGALALGTATFFGVLMRGTADGTSDPDYVSGVALHAAVRSWALPWAVLCVVSTLIPTTKTAAAMVIVPAIVNNQTLQKEASDLYWLAKQALHDAVVKTNDKQEKKQ